MTHCDTANAFPLEDAPGTGIPAGPDESTAGVSPAFIVLPGVAEQLRDMSVPDHNYVVVDERWFSTPERQRREAEADRDIAAGRLTHFSSVEDLIKDLKEE